MRTIKLDMLKKDIDARLIHERTVRFTPTEPNITPGKSRADGKSTVYVDCPACEVTTECFVWSLCGGGKVCPGCNVLLAYGPAFADKSKTRNWDELLTKLGLDATL